jgi:hypothetical protein
LRISKGQILAASITVAVMAIIMPVSLLSSSVGVHFQTATAATSATVTVTVSLAPATVTISGSTDVEGATLTYGTQDSTATAGALGVYSFAVPYNWTGVVTPTMTGYTFVPDHMDFANILADTSSNDFTPSLIVDVEQDFGNAIPKEYSLGQNYPNPFNPTTVIPFALPRGGFASMKVYNIVGQEVVNLLAGYLPAGAFRVTWDGADMNGKAVSSGVYFYRLRAGDYVEIKKMLLMK